MNKLIQLLTKVNNREIPVSASVSQDLIDLIRYTQNTKVDRNSARQYLLAQDKYETEEDLDIFMRDLFTVYVILHDEKDRNELNYLVKSLIKNEEMQLNNNTIRELIANGFKCYPVSYTANGMVLGIMTDIGHLIVA